MSATEVIAPVSVSTDLPTSALLKNTRNKDIITNAMGVAAAARDCEPRDVIIGCVETRMLREYGIGGLVDGYATLSAALGGDPQPNLLFHWAVIVGGYVHELDFERNDKLNFYQNKPLDGHVQFRPYWVGKTRFNDTAIVEEALKAISEPHMKPLYDVRHNNCQKFVIELLNLICEPGRRKVTTSFKWSAIERAESPVFRKMVLYPQDATKEEIEALQAEADAEYEARVAEKKRKREEARKVREAREAEEARAAEAQAQPVPMEELLQSTLELMARSEDEGQPPEPVEGTGIVALEAEVVV